jgi:hypothetical protein
MKGSFQCRNGLQILHRRDLADYLVTDAFRKAELVRLKTYNQMVFVELLVKMLT